MVTQSLNGKKRIRIVQIIMLLAFLGLLGFLFDVQVIRSEELQKKALQQWTRSTVQEPQRGRILDCNGEVLAQSYTAYKLLVWPKSIDNGDNVRVATELAGVTELSYDYVYARVSNDTKSEIVLARQLSRDDADRIESLNLGSGIVVSLDTARKYPQGSLASQLLGFTNIDGDGQDGIELRYNKFLAGIDGLLITQRDGKGQTVPGTTDEYIEPVEGSDVVLTIDVNVQSFLEKALKEALEVNSAKTAQGIIMDAETGAIIAVSSQPDYDPNDPPRDDLEALSSLSRDRVVSDAYEPGSTFKIITLASALDSGVVNDSYSCTCGGSSLVDGQRIKCWKSAGHGTQTLTQCAENSCNCAFMDFALKLGTEKFYEYIYSFGFGNAPGSGLSGESSGIVTHSRYIRRTDIARIGFGQSIAVTPLQLATAVCAAVNGGNLMQPYIIDRIVGDDGTTISQTEPTVVRRVISEGTSKKVCDILESVVKNGSGKNAQISGYRIGGKTGTAQKYEDGQIAQGKLIASFIGVAPMENPRFVCLILVDEPQVGTIFGSTVAAPFVKDVLEDTLGYYGYLPEGSDETVEVPNLIGLTVDEACAQLEALGLKGVYQESDVVTVQVPQEGQLAIVGTEVLLYTATTGEITETVQMVDVMGMTWIELEACLGEQGLTFEVEGVYRGGTVSWQSVAADAIIPEGTVIKVKFTL